MRTWRAVRVVEGCLPQCVVEEEQSLPHARKSSRTHTRTRETERHTWVVRHEPRGGLEVRGRHAALVDGERQALALVLEHRGFIVGVRHDALVGKRPRVHSSRWLCFLPSWLVGDGKRRAWPVGVVHACVVVASC